MKTRPFLLKVILLCALLPLQSCVEDPSLQQWKLGNLKRQDFYGRVIDQYGQPVTNVEVVGNLVSEYGWRAPEKFKQCKTHTDAAGLFQFTGLHGAKLGVVPSKPGYELGGHGEGFKGPDGAQSSPHDRATFTMWKLRGPEPMAHADFYSRVPYDGTPAIFNLATGKKAPDGDLRITLLRSPLKIKREIDKHDWTVKIEMANGGLLVESDPYPNWAPDKGYQSSFESGMSATNVLWSGKFEGKFYFKNARGQFGRLFIILFTDSLRPDTGIGIKTWINPSGSQNLEFDPKKQIHLNPRQGRDNDF